MSVPIAVLISGSGTNLQALIDAAAGNGYRIAVVVSNKRDAYGLERARAAGIPAEWLPGKDFPSREAYDAALVERLRAHGVEWVCMAGFLRLVTPVLLEAFPWRVLNIHPALLPSFPGLHAQQQAFDHGVRISGATVHLVDGGMDTGPIIAQGAVPVLPTDSVDTLQQRILRMEHRLFPMVLRWACSGLLKVVDGKVRVDSPEPSFIFDPSP